jgi:NADP-dependent 3-hydroxy acid dehydrogenase YdfG
MGIDEDPFGNDIMEEGFVEADDIGKYVAMVANLPNGTNVLESTVMPTRQPLVGRG